MSPAIETALSAVAARWKGLRIAEAALRGTGVFAAGAFLLFALDNLFHLGTGLRVVLALAWLGSSAAVAARVLWRPLRRPLTSTEAAILVERAVVEADNRIINTVRLEGDGSAPAPVLRLLRAEAEQVVQRLDLRRVLPAAALRPPAIAGGLAALLLAAYAVALPAHFANALRRYAMPGTFTPPITRTTLRVFPGDVTVVEGADAAVRAEVGGEIPPGVRIRVGDASYDMRFTGGSFAYEFRGVEAPFAYEVEAGDARSDVYRVGVRNRAKVRRLAVRCVTPEYLRLPPRVEDPAAGAIAAVEGARVEISLQTTKPLQTVRLAGEGIDARRRDDRWEFDVVRNGSYRFEWTDQEGMDGKSPSYAVSALKDQPPTVRLVEPSRSLAVRAESALTAVVQAADDFGLASVLLRAGVGGRAPVDVAAIPVEGREVRASRLVRARDLGGKPGDSIGLFATARDRKGNETASTTVTLRIVDDAEARDLLLKELAGIAARLRQVIARQRQVRERTVAPRPDPEALASAQSGILKTLAGIDAAWVNPELRHLAARARLQKAIQGPATKAVEQVRVDRRAAAATQAALIAELEAVVAEIEGVMASLKKGDLDRALAAAAEKSPRQEARDLLAGLKDFIEQQKKVLQESMDLRRVRPEDFSDEQKRQLETLRQTEEQWGKFLQEKATDLSKVPPQDFSNGVVVKELNEAFSEVKMAADALSRKAVEIAVPHEESGLELAQSITENIERWLADAPDNQKWVMEEPTKDVDVPMADLPSELEDLVGDLIDKEDQLAEESQDVTSSWMDSMNKGAGWTAMDGPISNMSAKGVTGNLQPNSQEIGGRSGEGRSGKSSGQMVEESASGKGGKQTPTRSTPDPFEAGRVKDTSKDPSGGSTGGGKVSGANKEGLRGEPPPAIRQQMERLADQQADIRNTAEKAKVAMQKRGYVSEDLARAVERMKALEEALRRKQAAPSAADAKAIAERLRAVQKTVQDQLDVTRDPARAAARESRGELLNALDEDIPAEFRDSVVEYYKALAR